MSSEAGEHAALPWTGERYIPELEGDIGLEHVHRYTIAREIAYGKDVLDIACGEGYGSELLATVARKVTGVDISGEAIAHASRKYTRPNISFAVGSCACIPLPDASVDLVVSFETIEHHDQHLEMMKEIRRVLRPEGALIISSPDKHEYSDVPGYRNDYHVKELYLSEFTDLLASEFQNVKVFGQRVYFGSLVAPMDGAATRFASYSRRDGNVRREPGVMKPIYYIALASNAALPEIHGGLYEGAAYLDAQFASRDGQIATLNQAVTERDGQIASLNQAVTERDGQIASLNDAVTERDGQIASLNDAVTERDGQIASLKDAAAERDGQIASLKDAAAERDGQIASRNQALAERDGQIAGLTQSVAERDGQIASLNQAVVERDGQITSLNQAVVERDGQITTLAGDVASHRVQIGSLKATVGEREASVSAGLVALGERQTMLDALVSELSQMKCALERMEKSRSWRLTAPLRALRRVIPWR
jgi:SAM-dependent methyltransferase/peptidoglycan hydrolase CwlO-like protein